ncbi:uncharacterized protein BXZ73DRAFT_90716 [Epithele typhae]|uniref:uncharacterized protein n=1 Tax=Epithele typhae TaxID=378194 RepID=UPI002008E5C8|nr:uncharacterized protein BXZ73DRAFT_90716 [Epithele typhae]KAH9927437.1 hypothetical protein BXZ73DRAFT_90716 [Epithele typhae]
MRFSTGALSLLSLAALSAASGTTVEPTNGETIDPDTSFPFDYENANICHSGYSHISVYLSDSAPTSADISGGELVAGSFIFKFGDWLIPNFGLPAMTNPPPPPSSLQMPELDSVADGTTLFFSVVETFGGCPPDGHTEYGLETTTVVYA